MSGSILNNVSAMNASRQLGITGQGLQQTIQRLTTGKRINKASDDAAGLAIANKLGADVRIAGQGQRNANDGISYLQVADGVLDEITNLLTRAAELAQQASSGTSGADSGTGKAALNAEFQNIISTIADIEGKTVFNGASVFNAASALAVAVGGFTTVNVTVGTFNTLSASTDSLLFAASASAAAGGINTALNAVSALRGTIGATQQQLTSLASSLGIQMENFTAAQSQIQDANVSKEVVALSKFQVLNQSGISALGQANQASQSILKLLQ